MKPPLQLALFDAADLAAPLLQRPAPGAAAPAPLPPAPAPLPPPATPAPPPAEFRHPRAEREIRLEGHLVAYALRRARRRSIGFVVGAEGLAVNAPKWVALRDIEAALREKGRWIVRKLAEQRERRRLEDAARVHCADGAVFPFLGRPVVVRLHAATTGAVLHDAAPGDPADVPAAAQLRLGLDGAADPARIADRVQQWLRRQAHRIFAERIAHYEPRLGVRCTRLALSSAGTRWGSASTNGSIRLHWRLVHLPLATIDYVVAHELAHLREMNHGPRFWALVGSVVPDYESERQRLRKEVLPVFG